jgi:hypothetical protein
MLFLPWKYAITCFPFRFTQKYSTPTLGVSNQKYFPIPTLHSSSYKCSSILVVISQNSVIKRGLSCIERREREKGLVSKIKGKKKKRKRKEKKREKYKSNPSSLKSFRFLKEKYVFKGQE